MHNQIHMSPTIGALAEALAKAQASFPSIERNREVEVETKRGGRYRFKYATLDHILERVRGPLAKHGLAVTQLVESEDGTSYLSTLLMHGPSGEWLRGRLALPTTDGAPHELGSLLTYLRRYSLNAVLGIEGEEDDDGNRAQGNGAQARPAGRGTGSRPATRPAEDRPDTKRARIMQKIGAHVKRLNVGVPELREYAVARFGVEPPQLDAQQTTTLLKILQSLKNRSAWEAEVARWRNPQPDGDYNPGDTARELVAQGGAR